MLTRKFTLSLFFCAALILSCDKSQFNGYEKLIDINLLTDYLTQLTPIELNHDQIYRDADSDVEMLAVENTSESDPSRSLFKNNTLILITHDTYCGFCIDELDFWNEWSQKQLGDSFSQSTTDIKLIVVDDSKKNVRNFVARNNYSMSTYQDEEKLITQWVEHFQIPLKIFVDGNRKVRDIRPVGSNENLNYYVRMFLDE
ncbi:MAG: hypothetical protein JJU41_04280 [Bacteroidetes bacterium]|nr:hypothetical protein [Bacteroidota bacterium]MCH8523684.1 hypothetical protein [Balneolales bacterium]